jgi:hypothetical protein
VNERLPAAGDRALLRCFARGSSCRQIRTGRNRKHEKAEAPSTLVGEMIRYVIESDDGRLRFPVGPDALAFLGWRCAVSDEDWVGMGGFENDADYFQRVFIDTGVDLRQI